VIAFVFALDQSGAFYWLATHADAVAAWIVSRLP
jgi:hypothetical protein